ncbi:MAG: bifunctional hydroxymethylpyrimidine kinase/phosphomethylpyrimidine kinase [Bacteroides sp.]|nr:bifunctional hydroxymethylpyrimidine kinase/phosphomethylpyrimidine kinase [Bacteroides sp.]
MKKIVITLPHFIDNEAARIVSLLDNGTDLVHLRKPEAGEGEVARLIESIPVAYRSRLVVHDHHALATRFSLHGIHLNSRHPHAPEGYRGNISRSCHSLEEIERYKPSCSYLFLSPIFDSISKQGYTARYTTEELETARKRGIIDEQVIALGGVTTERFSLLQQWGFGGGAMLGAAWERKTTKEQATPPVILTIAGSDCSGGAGIQADIKAISALGGYAASVITAVTVQNTLGVQHALPIPTEVVDAQIRAVMDDLQVSAVKIGMVHDSAIARTIAGCLKHYRPVFTVYDPVMISTSGHRLLTEESIDTIKQELLPLATLITPNLHEATLLCGRTLDSIPAMEQAARELSGTYGPAVLIKGGHLTGQTMCDVLYADGCLYRYVDEKIETRNLHGTGCTLSSAIATLLSHGHSLPKAVERAKSYITRAIKAGSKHRIGHGNGPVWHFV